jgi:hypothetical protein
MRQGQIPSQFDRRRKIVLKAIQPIRTADLQSYFYGKRTTAGGNLPPYYLVYFLLIELLKFPHLAKAEKVAWSIPVSFNDNIFVIEHRKLGLGVFAPESEDHEAAAAEIVRLVHKGVRAAEPFFEWIADEAVKSSELNVINRSESLFGRFEFLLEQHNSLSNEALARTGERQVEEKVSGDGKQKTTTVRFPEFELRLKAKWLALSVIEAFFSWTEHVFIHLAVLRGSIFTASEVSDLASAEWQTKFDRAVGTPTGVMATLFNQLLAFAPRVTQLPSPWCVWKRGSRFAPGASGGQCDCVDPDSPTRAPAADCRRFDDCGQTPLGCVRASGHFPPDAGRVGGGASSNHNSHYAKPGAPRKATLLCVGRSSVRCGHTSRRHFGEDAQRFF